MVRQHLERNIQFYGEHKGLILFRKHAMRYLALQRLPRVRRTKIILQNDAKGFLGLLDEAILELG
jgi:tRNA-dihydrouridine synthase